MRRAEVELKPLRRFLLERRWRLRVGSYDQYGGPRMLVMLEPAPTEEQLQELYAKFGDAYEFADLSVQFNGEAEGAHHEPTVGERKASAMYGATPGLRTGPPDDALWLIEEWDGSKWLRVREVRGHVERDRLLYRE